MGERFLTDKKRAAKPKRDSGDGVKKQRFNNRGRSDFRNVTRTAARSKGVQEQFSEGEEHGPSASEESEEEEELETAGDAAVDEKGKAYNALLTLLNAENVSESESESEEEDPEAQEEAQQQVAEDEDGIAGNVGAEQDGKDQEEEEDEDDEEEDNSDDEKEIQDPFEQRFNHFPEDTLNEAVEFINSGGKWVNTKKTFENYSCLISSLPKLPNKPTNSIDLNDFSIKSRLLEPFLKKFGKTYNKSEISKMIIDPLFNYKDILLPYESFKNQNHYRRLYALHCINHVHKSRDRIVKNNWKLSSQNEKLEKGLISPNEEVEFRDQGFTKAKVLVLLPTRDFCYRVINHFIEVSGAEQVENNARFKQQFYENTTPGENKPEDFQDLFNGDTNDFFCLGVKFTKKAMRLYTSFYGSDIIFASPIGLQMILENPNKKKQQQDFLSSIELLIIDQANSIELQNWDHIFTIFKYLNKIPKEFHDADFSRVRMWSIDEKAKYFTQSLVFGEYITPNISNVITRSKNINGKYKFKRIVKTEESAMFKVGLKIKQIFKRFDSSSPLEDANERFNYFKSVIIPTLTNSTTYEDGLLLYIPSYTDFLRVKNYMHEKTSILFSDINEYSNQSQLSRSRTLFQQGRSKILLYTERLHHYRRFELKGIKNILMYGVPNNPIFYTEIVSCIGRSVYDGIADFDISNVRILYSKWDAAALERIVGTKRAPLLTHGQNEFYEFR